MTQGASVLIIDDDPEIREIVSLLLNREGFIVREAFDFDSAMLMLNTSINLIILDIMMPDCSGLELCSKIRKTTMVPILFLTAKAQDSDKEAGFSRGGDDYLVKPFSSVELVSRVKALLRRHLVYQQPLSNIKPNILRHCELAVNLDTGVVSLHNQEVLLTSTEYQVLVLLLKNRKKVLSAREIYEQVWKETFLPVSNNAVMVHIKNLRKKLEKDWGHPQYIRTVWGKGYYIG
ncbi:response regulator transcription factor [Anaerotignum sp. MB30-C6]|uniref:response regulator transcription factor n=1 Tax=Anaerotignum sp. MB30-C6 TaxID=3070814 RepID=UPI0027DE699D|nr:response regulator transcription factor [Anaerotignum sp. MB30-C6]WMI80772.1 response regulator transcription factor [Anaerotignum sp. MB30-C6]